MPFHSKAFWTFSLAICLLLPQASYSFSFNGTYSFLALHSERPPFLGFEIRDLEEKTSYFNTEAFPWQITNRKNAQNVSTCDGTLLLGGYGVADIGTVFQRTYTILPGHNMIQYSFEFWIIDLTPASSLFKVYFDNQLAGTWDSSSIPLTSYLFTSSVCGGSQGDMTATPIKGQVPHSTATLNLQIQSLSASSLGFRNVNLLFLNSTATAETSSCSLGPSLLGINPSCLCSSGSYDPPGLLPCTACNSACATCSGPTSSDCTSCNAGYSFYGGRCQRCDSACSQCSGPSSSECTSCSSDKFLYWNGTCLDNCAGVLIQDHQGMYKQCKLPCDVEEYYYPQNDTCSAFCDNESGFQGSREGDLKTCKFICEYESEFLYWNGTCQNTCENPLISKIQGLSRNCELPCNLTQYYYQNGTCATSCEFGWVESYSGDLRYCMLACREFLYQNSSCLETCEKPFVQTKNGEANYCNFPCKDQEFLYTNGSCLSTCDDPFIENIQGVKRYCELPCQDANNYLFENKTCVEDCPAPFVIFNSYCESPCSAAQFYSEESKSCISQCDSPKIVSNQGELKLCLETPPPPKKTSTSSSSMVEMVNSVKKRVDRVTNLLRSSSTSSVFMIALAKMVKYVKFIDVTLPEEVRQAFDSSNSGMFSISTTFSYSMPQSLEASISRHPLPRIFENRNLHSSYLMNQWESLSTLSIVVGFGLLFALLHFFAKKKAEKYPMFEYSMRRFKIITRWNLLMFLLFNCYDDFTLYLILELKTLKLNNFAAFLSFGVCLVATGFAIYFLIQIVLVCREWRKMKKGQEVSFYKKWENSQVFYAGFKDSSIVYHSFLFTSTIRIVFCYVLVGILYAYPLVQSILLNLMSVVILALLLKGRPIKDTANYIFNILFEIMILLVNICLLTLAIADQYQQGLTDFKERVGQTILILNTTISVLATVYLVSCLIFCAYSCYQTCKIKGRYRRTVWFNMLFCIYSNPGMDFDDLSNVEVGDVLKKMKKNQVLPIIAQEKVVVRSPLKRAGTPISANDDESTQQGSSYILSLNQCSPISPVSQRGLLSPSSGDSSPLQSPLSSERRRRIMKRLASVSGLSEIEIEDSQRGFMSRKSLFAAESELVGTENGDLSLNSSPRSFRRRPIKRQSTIFRNLIPVEENINVDSDSPTARNSLINEELPISRILRRKYTNTLSRNGSINLGDTDAELNFNK